MDYENINPFFLIFNYSNYFLFYSLFMPIMAYYNHNLQHYIFSNYISYHYIMVNLAFQHFIDTSYYYNDNFIINFTNYYIFNNLQAMEHYICSNFNQTKHYFF